MERGVEILPLFAQFFDRAAQVVHCDPEVGVQVAGHEVGEAVAGREGAVCHEAAEGPEVLNGDGFVGCDSAVSERAVEAVLPGSEFGFQALAVAQEISYVLEGFGGDEV